MLLKKISLAILMSMLTSCGSESVSQSYSSNYSIESGRLSGKKGIVSAKVNYEIDYAQNSISFDGKAKALGMSFNLDYQFYSSDSLLYTSQMIDAGVGYEEELEGDEGYVAEITKIDSQFVTITVRGENSTIVLYSDVNREKLNIAKSDVNVRKPVGVSLELLPR